MNKHLLWIIFILNGLFAFGQNIKNDWIIIPGVRVGPITAKTSEKELEKIFGFTNVYKDSRNTWAEVGEEGQSDIVTYVFKDTKNEICIFWKDKTYSKVSSIDFRNENSNWHLEGGLRVGSTIDELKTYNQGEFYFFGFGWDLGGVIINDNLQGKMKKLRDVLSITLEGTDKTKDSRFSGDNKKISSNTENLFELTNAKINSISINLIENYIQPNPIVSKVDYGRYSMFGKFVAKDAGGSMFSNITIRIEPNKYFQYFRDYDENLGDYCKKKIIKSVDYSFSIAFGKVSYPTQYFNGNQIISYSDFISLLEPNTLIGIKFEDGYLNTKNDGYTLVEQGDGDLVARSIYILK